MTHDEKPPDAEFDIFAQNYRQEQDKHLWATGESSEYYAEYKVRKLLEWLPELQNEKINIVDFGCGDGVMTEFLRRYFLYANIVGVDVSQVSIEIAQHNVDNVDFKLIENEQIPLPVGWADLVVSAGVFHHIPPEQHAHWISQLYALLKPSGNLVIFELNPLNIGTQYIFRTHPMEKNAKMLWPWRTKKLLHNFARKKNMFYCFFPRWFKFLRFFEPWLTWLPFGGLYACIAHKN